VGGKELV